MNNIAMNYWRISRQYVDKKQLIDDMKASRSFKRDDFADMKEMEMMSKKGYWRYIMGISFRPEWSSIRVIDLYFWVSKLAFSPTDAQQWKKRYLHGQIPFQGN